MPFGRRSRCLKNPPSWTVATKFREEPFQTTANSKPRLAKKMHIALIGASGYVGTEFEREIQSRGYRLTTISRRDCDLYSHHDLESFIKQRSPDVLVNCAGYTGKPNVDACELDKTNCLAGNAVLPGIIAKVCERLELPWGQVSSGCIYTGRRPDGKGFDESDSPNFSFRQNNCSFYSGTKALGEEVLAGAKDCYIWRLRIPFSNVDSSRNYLSKLMRYNTLLEAENSLSHLGEFVSASLDCFEKQLPYGTYNLTNPGSVKTSEVVDMIRDAGVSDREFKYFDNESEFMRKAAKTPRSNCVMNSSKALSAGLTLSPIREVILKELKNWVAERTTAQRV